MDINWRKKEKGLPHGVVTIKVTTFSEFVSYIDYVHRTTGVNRQYVWRGQGSSAWKLHTTLDRKLFWPLHFLTEENSKYLFEHQSLSKLGERLSSLLKYELPSIKVNQFMHGFNLKAYLNDFKLAVRGRRGANPPVLLSDNDWWALGQHHGLRTPLLDWTGSPFVACFFSFSEDEKSPSSDRVVYGLWEEEVCKINQSIVDLSRRKLKIKDVRVPLIEFVRPFSDENPRLVGQRGLFTRAPLGIDIEKWIEINCDANYDSHILIKIILPDNIRQEALRALNRMNINHLSLFPDLIGASKYSNMNLDDFGYSGG